MHVYIYPYTSIAVHVDRCTPALPLTPVPICPSLILVRPYDHIRPYPPRTHCPPPLAPVPVCGHSFAPVPGERSGRGLAGEARPLPIRSLAVRAPLSRLLFSKAIFVRGCTCRSRVSDCTCKYISTPTRRSLRSTRTDMPVPASRDPS